MFPCHYRLHALDFRAKDDTLLVRRRPEAQTERTLDPIALATATALFIAKDVELGLDRLGNVLAAPKMTFLESNATRTVDALESFGVDRGEVGSGPLGQMLTVAATEADAAGEAVVSGANAVIAATILGSCFDKNFEDVTTHDVVDGVDVVLVALGVERGGGARFRVGDGGGDGTLHNGDRDMFATSDLLPWWHPG